LFCFEYVVVVICVGVVCFTTSVDYVAVVRILAYDVVGSDVVCNVGIDVV